ncbi:MAG TPA: hypothetical protein VHO47_04890 [Candidatus Babeliales bacterium]|nr:hypothetical protein [Candidatus Babeliales bacterium]
MNYLLLICAFMMHLSIFSMENPNTNNKSTNDGLAIVKKLDGHPGIVDKIFQYVQAARVRELNGFKALMPDDKNVQFCDEDENPIAIDPVLVFGGIQTKGDKQIFVIPNNSIPGLRVKKDGTPKKVSALQQEKSAIKFETKQSSKTSPQVRVTKTLDDKKETLYSPKTSITINNNNPLASLFARVTPVTTQQTARSLFSTGKPKDVALKTFANGRFVYVGSDRVFDHLTEQIAVLPKKINRSSVIYFTPTIFESTPVNKLKNIESAKKHKKN